MAFSPADKVEYISLNDILMWGLDLTNLVGFLTRFRKDRVAWIGDVETMFHSIESHNSDSDNIDGGNIDYRLEVHIVNATSFPCFCYLRLLNREIGHCFFVVSKFSVTHVTPRLELITSAFSLLLYELVKRESTLPIFNYNCFTDSTANLYYIIVGLSLMLPKFSPFL